jgi:hypothetical protein
MLLEDARILLMNADRLLDHVGAPVQHIHLCVEILDGVKAVTAEFQRIGEFSEAIFTDIEDVLAAVAALRPAIGHDEFGRWADHPSEYHGE